MKIHDAYYDLKFENHFHRAKGDAFQDLFERLMGLAFKADFVACRPWGDVGDRKNDGFLKSERRLFQVYAPNEMSAKKATFKITHDFEGARQYWGTHFDRWTFVHNAVDGLPPHVLELLLNFEKSNAGIQLVPWGLEELRLVFRMLSQADLASWLGPAPTDATNAVLGFKDLQVVLESLAGRVALADTAVGIVPPGKIEANDLSESVATLIKGGMTKAPLVSAFFDRWHDETLGSRLAVAFREEYERLRGSMHPNMVFSELQTWAGGNALGTPEHQMAVLTVLAYYFERCDIFEQPKANAQ